MSFFIINIYADTSRISDHIIENLFPEKEIQDSVEYNLQWLYSQLLESTRTEGFTCDKTWQYLTTKFMGYVGRFRSI